MGIGEAEAIGSIPAAQNAIIDVAHSSVRDIDMPTSSLRVAGPSGGTLAVGHVPNPGVQDMSTGGTGGRRAHG
jgi:hypothetical protein